MKTSYAILSVLLVLPITLFSQGFKTTDVDSNTVALWHFDEGSGSVLHDASPYHNDGVIHNATWVEGKFGDGLHFDGLTSYVSLPLSASLKTRKEFTIEAWASFDTLYFGSVPFPDVGAATLLSCYGPYPDGGGYGLGCINYGSLIYDYRINPSGSHSIRNAMISQSHHFYHIAVVYKADSTSTVRTKLYIDGVQADSGTFADTVQYSNTDYFYIGTERTGRAVGGSGVRDFPGILDEIRISKVALDPHNFGATTLRTSDNTISYGLVKIGDAVSRDLIVSNTSFKDTLYIDSIAISNNHFSVNTTPFVLLPVSNHSLSVSYEPSQVGEDTGSLLINATNFGIAPAIVLLDGQGFALGAAPTINSIADIPGDQGKQVRVIWYPSLYDSATASPRVNDYSVWRRVDDMAVLQSVQSSKMTAGGFGDNKHRYVTLDGELWDYIVSVPAVLFDRYAYVAPTLHNATQAGIQWTVFRVASHLSNGEFFFSSPDSGFSYDNFFPPPPQNIKAKLESQNLTVYLSWGSVSAPDLKEYRVYRSSSPAFVITPSIKIAVTRGTAYYDSLVTPGSTYFYGVTAVDSSDNESAASLTAGGVQITSVHDSKSPIPGDFVLKQNYPNPFNPATTIEYGLPKRSRVTLTVFNMLGQQIAKLSEGIQDAGYHAKTWVATVGSGIYLYRLDAADVNNPQQTFSEVRKMVFIK